MNYEIENYIWVGVYYLPHMKEIPAQVKRTFRELKDKMDQYIELRYTGGSYAVRKATSVWDKEEKKPKKVTEHIGTISKEGAFREKIPRKAIRGTTREVFEYGNSALAYHFLKDIEDILYDLTPYTEEIIAYAIIKIIDSKPLRLLKSRWNKFYLSQEMRVSLSPKHISSVLHEIGTEVSSLYELFSELIADDDILLCDLTKIFTYSENIKIAEKGWNSKHSYLNQIGIIMAFSLDTQLPIGIEVFPGSMKETKAIRDFRRRLQQKDIGYIWDRGFTDYDLLDELREDNTHYIVPLKKNSKFMDCRWVRWKGPFEYQERHIRWGRRRCDRGYIYFYDDPKVRGEQETALLKRVKKGKISMDDFEKKKEYAGIIGIMSDLDKNGAEIYDFYKTRQDIELTFDALNNVVDADKTYLRSEEGVRGYYFVSFVALRIYFSILKRLREKDLSTKISVDEVLFELSKIMRIQEKNGREYFAKIPKKTKEIMELFPKAFNEN